MPEFTPEELASFVDLIVSKRREFVTVNNAIFDKAKVSHLIQDPKGKHEVAVYFDNGEKVTFTGAEAAEIWRVFDPDWRSGD